MKYQLLIVVLSAIGVTSLFGAQPSITSFLSSSQGKDFAAFMDFVQLQGDDRQQFKLFYEGSLAALQDTRSHSKKNQQLRHLEQHGMNSLEIKRPQWARELTALLKKDHPLYSNAQRFVIRFGSLENYYKDKARARNSTWVRLRGFVMQTKETVAGWFSSLRPQRTVA